MAGKLLIAPFLELGENEIEGSWDNSSINVSVSVSGKGDMFVKESEKVGEHRCAALRWW